MRLLLPLLLGLSLCACGQKGPLYLPATTAPLPAAATASPPAGAKTAPAETSEADKGKTSTPNTQPAKN